MNLTLAFDSQLLKEARKAALEMDTTVNSLVRDYLKEFVRKKIEESDLFLNEWLQLMESNAIDMKNRTWTRDELHER